MLSQRWTILTVLSLVLTVAASGQAQQLAPSGVTRHDNPVTADTVSTEPAAEGSRLVGAARGALIGAGVGAVGGFIAGVALSTSASDRSENDLAIFALATIGAFVGLVGGAIIGAAVAR